MNRKRNQFLHYTLIILLMFAPLSGAMAVPVTHCQMEEMQAMDSVQASMSQVVLDQTITADHQCCCCDDGCASNCDMGINVSLIMQTTPYGPIFKKLLKSVNTSTNILVRALTPPSRPPANLYN